MPAVNTIRNNLLTLIAAIKEHPENGFDLGQFRNKTECSTLYCSAGLAATIPFFRAQLPSFEQLDFADYAYTLATSEEMWGGRAYPELFAAYGEGRFDAGLTMMNGPMTDKQLAIARLELRLQDYPEKTA